MSQLGERYVIGSCVGPQYSEIGAGDGAIGASEGSEIGVFVVGLRDG